MLELAGLTLSRIKAKDPDLPSKVSRFLFIVNLKIDDLNFSLTEPAIYFYRLHERLMFI